MAHALSTYICDLCGFRHSQEYMPRRCKKCGHGVFQTTTETKEWNEMSREERYRKAPGYDD